MNTLQYSIKGAFRIAQTTRILAQTGLSWVLGDRPPAPALLRQTFERLGATYVKLGQFIASSPSLFPEEYVEEFQRCLDQTESVSFDLMSKVLKQELKKPIETVYTDLDPQPLASASIAQVHAARLSSGEDVVVKIQKPGVENIILADLNFLYLGARFLELLKPKLSWASLSAIVSDIQRTTLEECNFLKEASNIKKFHEFLSATGNDQVVVPKVYDQATTLRVLTLERLYGVALTDLNSIRKYTRDPEQTLIAAMNTWFSSLLFCEFFHADVHAGNLMVLEDGRIGFIDFGIVGRISPASWMAMSALIEGIGKSDYQAIARALIEIGVTQNKVDPRGLAEDLEELFGRLEELQPSEQEINRLILDTVTLGEQHGLHFPREFALLLKQFLYFDRYIQLLTPELNLYGDSRVEMFPGA